MTQLRFLSAEWLAALGGLVAAASVAPDEMAEGERAASPAEVAAGSPTPADPASDAAPARSLRLGQIVTGGPGGEVAYTLVLGGEAAGVVAGVEGADVTLVESYETARAMAAGETTAGEALAGGLVKVRGNANLVIGAAPLLSGLAEAAEALRGRTSF